jgi:branched-chain amino acid transport system substrate-binding protein
MIRKKKILALSIILAFSMMFFIDIVPLEAKVSQTTVKIGALGPLAITPGEDMRKGAELAVEEINENGFTAGSTSNINFELITETTSGTTGLPDPGTATTSLRKLIDDDGVVAILGGFRTEVVVTIQAGLGTTPFLGVGSTAPLLTPHYWRVGPTNGSQLGKSIAEFYLFYASALGVKNITVAREDATWTTVLGGLIKLGLSSNQVFNFTFTEDIVISTGASAADVKSAMTPASADGYSDAILTLFSAPVGKSVTEAWAELNMSQLLAGINVEAQKSTYFVDTAGAAYGEIALQTADINNPTPKGKAFSDAYKAKYGEEPTYTSFASYDAVYLIMEAMKASGGITSEKIEEGLTNIDYEGASAKIKFTSEIGPQYAYFANFTPYIIPGFPARGDIVVHDLYTPDDIGTSGNGYVEPVMVQWQKNGERKTVYVNLATRDTGLVEFPINHADFGEIPGQTTSPGFEIATILVVIPIFVAISISRRKRN